MAIIESPMRVLFTFAVLFFVLRLTATYGIPSALALGAVLEPSYIPLDPATLPSPPPLGTLAPTSLNLLEFPVTLILHVDCLGCTYLTPESVLMAYREPGVVNVVVAEDDHEYKVLANQVENVRLFISSPTLAKELGVNFGPRVYRFDASKRLC